LGEESWFEIADALLDAVFWVSFALFLACSAAFVFYGWRYRQAVRRNAQERRDLLKTIVFAAAAFALLTVLTAVVALQQARAAEAASPEAVRLAAIASAAESAQSGSRLLDYKLERFSRQVTPVSCVGARELVYWRELRVYNVTRVDSSGKTSTAYYSTITLTLRNEGSTSLYDVVVHEKIPDAIAAEPNEVINFSVAPLAVRKGSVAIDWMFQSVAPGETKSVSYTVEKRVSKDLFDGLTAPSVAVQRAAASPSPSPSIRSVGNAISSDWLFLVPLFVVLAFVALYFENLYKRRLEGYQ
jgi:hypothetical protein